MRDSVSMSWLIQLLLSVFESKFNYVEKNDTEKIPPGASLANTN